MNAAEAHGIRIPSWELLLIVIALGTRLWGLDAQSIWRDEADSLQFAGSPALLREMFVTPGHNAPLYYVMLRGWTRIAGANIVSARFFSALWGTLAVACMIPLGRRLFTPKVACFSALLGSLSPYLTWYSQEARTYAPFVAMTLLSFWLYVRALDDGGVGRWAAYIASVGVCLYLHIMALLLLPVHILAGLLLKKRRTWWGWSIAIVLLGIVALPMLRWGIPLLLSPFRTGHLPVHVGQAVAGLLLSFTVGVSGRLSPRLAWPSLFLALIGSAFGWRPSRVKSIGTLWIWLLVPTMSLILISLDTPIFSERYLVFVAPAFYMLAGLGLGFLWDYWKPLASVLLLATLAVSGMALWVQCTQTIKPDFRAAALYYEARKEPGDLVLFVIPQAQGAFAHVAPAGEQQRYAGAPYANRVTDQAALDEQLRQCIADSRRVWLVESEAELWDEHGLIRTWLSEHGREIVRLTFHQVTLTLYEMGVP